MSKKEGFNLLVCPNFRREVAAIIRSENYPDVQIVSLPMTCIRPAPDDDAISRLAAARADQGGDVIALGSYCLRMSPNADGPCQTGAGNVKTAVLARCQEWVANASLIDTQIDAGAYVLTPGWLANWRRYIREWGFDEKTAREFFAETTRKLALLDTGIYERSETDLREFAAFLALPYELIPVGLDLLRRRVIRVMRESV
jgi:hypothetical protein